MLGLHYSHETQPSPRNIPQLPLAKDVMQLGHNSHLKEVLKVLSTKEVFLIVKRVLSIKGDFASEPGWGLVYFVSAEPDPLMPFPGQR